METRMPSGLVAKTFSFGAGESAAPAAATKHANVRPNAKPLVFIIGPAFMGVSGGFLGHNLRFLSRLRRVMNHRVSVFHAHAISASLLFDQAHERIVVLLVFPIALPFKQSSNGGQPHRPSLHHARESRFVRRRRGGSAAILNDINVVAGAEHLDGGPGDTDLGPETREDDIFAPSGLDGFAEFLGVPRVHRAALNHGLAWKNIEQLRPDVA